MITFYDFDVPAMPSGLVFLGSKTAQRDNSAADNSTPLNDLLDTSGNPITLQEGDLVVAFHVQTDQGSALQGNLIAAEMKDPTYSDAMTSEIWVNDTYDVAIFVAYKLMGSTPDTTMVLKGAEDTNGGHGVVLMAFRGAHATPFEATYGTASDIGSSSSSIDPASVTPSAAGSFVLVFGAFAQDTPQATAPSQPSDLSSTTNEWVALASTSGGNEYAMGVGMKKDWTSGAFNPAAWTGTNIGTSATWAAVTLVLKPA